MGINDILQKNNPMQKKIDRENRSDFAKLVDRNTELVDKMNDLQERIDKAIEYKNQLLFDLNRQYITFEKWEEILEPLENILKGEDKE
jgi:cell division protein FtsB